MKFTFADRLGINPVTLESMDCTDVEGFWIILEKEMEEKKNKNNSGVSDRVLTNAMKRM
jgi:hypothetical protein